MCEKRGECIRRCFGEHRLLYHAELQTVDLEDGICWQAKHIGEGVMDKCRWRQRSPHTIPLPTNYMLRLTSHSLFPCQSQVYWKDEYALCRTIHLHSSLFPICVNTVQWAQCLWTRNSTHETEMKWEEKRMGNCLSCRSPSLYIGYLSAVIAPFNVPGECR